MPRSDSTGRQDACIDVRRDPAGDVDAETVGPRHHIVFSDTTDSVPRRGVHTSSCHSRHVDGHVESGFGIRFVGAFTARDVHGEGRPRRLRMLGDEEPQRVCMTGKLDEFFRLAEVRDNDEDQRDQHERADHPRPRRGFHSRGLLEFGRGFRKFRHATLNPPST